uniref:Anillin n=1 Tax=Callorhinchus milii TaxID=7868 RepID=A0A4W3GR23_CALMI
KKLLERTRARRENLQKKMSERPTAAGRQIAKRIREPLCEANNQPSEAAEEGKMKDSTKPSPSKRRCSDKVETAVSGVENKEPETPMATTVVVPPASQPAELVQEQEVQDLNPKSTAASVKNRMQQLAAQRQNWDGDGQTEAAQQASPPPPHQTPTSVQPGTPAGRRARLNNLAATISSWEDDLSRPTAKQNKPQGQPGTACLPVSGRAPATVNSSILDVIPFTVQSTKVIPPSPKKTEEPKPLATKGPINSDQVSSNLKKIEELRTLATKGPLNPNLATLNLKKIEEPKPLETKGPLNPNLATLNLKKIEEPKPLETKGPLQSAQANSGVKSFLERFSERCQERSASNPKAPTPGLKSPVTPNTKAIQERLFKQQELSTTASLTQQLKQEKVPSSPAKSSPLRKVMFVSEQLNVIENKVGKVSEVEMSVDDELNSSAVINELFEGVMEEDEDVDDDEERESELNISSMSLLAPLAVASPEVRPSLAESPCFFNNNTPDNAKRSKFQRTRLTRAESTDSMGSSTDDQNLLYSIDAYRSQRIKPTERPPVKQIIVRKEDVTQRLEERRAATPSSVNIKQRMKNLSNDINIQQSVIHQASQALNCCTDEDHGKGSQQEAEAERLLLIASERRMVLLAELNKLKTEGASAQKKAESAAKAVGDFAPSRGSISLSEIRLPLKADFICSTAHKTGNFYFFVLIRAGALNMVATPLASTQNAVSGDAITFPTKFTLQDVSNDFEIEIEVYSLVCTQIKYQDYCTVFKILLKSLSSPGGPNAVRSSNFVMVGSYKIVLSSVGNTKFQLDKVPFLCPIQGHIYVKLQCQVGSSVEEHGFLTMFHDVSGFGAWHRRWCVLSGACISYWTYPDDEKCKRPLGRINLANCTSRKIDPANREFCARPNTFELITVRPQREDDRETLVSECKNTLCVTKNWLSADTKEERNLWMQKLNRVLVDLRTWQPDACYRPQVI